MPSKRKRVALSLSPEAYAKLEDAAKAAGVTPTRHAAQIVAEALEISLRPAHNPNWTTNPKNQG